ncbi:response regulator transcription factor [Cryobacterium sp. TMS1-20-1]|uniref:response regulator transcription factor n=1 Tax=Cryobacterium sp. TMS1-20-1 TaxID=1259223 RepID=UPI00106ADAF8|nr:response regulator transcription factor [Cryobacterium sp. TMS1-20-1]TFC75783.1 response regulator transcription factor [Cryobacterium sp. TMS1-20-1]
MTEIAERVAVVLEDDADIGEVLEAILIEAGFVVKIACTGAAGVQLVRDLNPTLTTLDVNMPGMDGFETLKRLRLLTDRSIIMISARFDEIDVVRGLGAGADDFVAKPFRTGELRARIDAVLRRAPVAAEPDSLASGWLQHDGLRLNPERRLVEVERASVLLTRSEFDLLASLIQHGNRVHSKAELILELRGESYVTSGRVTDSDRRSLEVDVANVRRKIGRTSSGAERIETVRGVGYRLAAAS